MSNYPEVYPASKPPASTESAELGQLGSSTEESLSLGAGDAEPARAQT